MSAPVAVVLAQAAPDILSSAWGAVFQAGAVGVLLTAALWLIVVKGLLRPEREITDRDTRLAKVEAECAKEVADTRADYERRLTELRADHERVLTAERARYTEMASAYEQRIARAEAVAAKQEAMLFDLTGAARSLAQVSTRREKPP